MFKFLQQWLTRFLKPQLTVPEQLARSAEKEWKRDILEESYKINLDITQMFDSNGWGIWLRSPDGGGCPQGYSRPPDPDWCGHAVANHALKLKTPVNKVLCRKVFPSTYRLSRRNKWEDLGLPFPLIEDHSDLKRGDIVVLRWENGKVYGDHITVAISDLKEDGTFDTVEGNASGTLPQGEGRGLVRYARKKAQVARIYRLTKEHLKS